MHMPGCCGLKFFWIVVVGCVCVSVFSVFCLFLVCVIVCGQGRTVDALACWADEGRVRLR